MADEEYRMDQLAALDELDDFDVADNEPDPRGWSVLTSDGREIGEVDEMIVDTASMKVRYLDCAVDEDELDLEEEDRHILIPIGYARLDEDDKEVLVDRLDADDIANLPAFRGLPLTRDQEQSIETRFAEPSAPTGGFEQREEPEGIRVTRAEEELTTSKREREAGEVDIEKHVETEHVRQPVTRRHEEVDIERRPAARAGGREEAEMKDEEVHIPLTEEEVEVEKHPEIKEELVVRKRPVEETEEVETDVRKERVDIDRHGDIEERERGRRRR